MAFEYDRLIAWPPLEVRHRYGRKDTMLYALSLGLGADPLDARQLRFVYEDGLQAMPTYPVVLGYPGFWLKEQDTGVDWVKVVHGEQGLRLHRPIPAEGEVVGRTRITGIVDKGAGKGALIYQEREVFDAVSGDLLATLSATSFCRGDGGCGGPGGPARPAHALPPRAPDIACDLETIPQAALIYRLNGDYNPLHVDPAVAAAAGYARPILHGLCTFGIASHAIVKSLCEHDPSRLRSIEARFSAPVLPGETIRTEIWFDGAVASFRARAVERNALVLDNGRAEIGIPLGARP